MNKLKFLSIISLIYIENVVPQTASCVYSDDKSNGYKCSVTLMHADESTAITGQHLEAKSDDDVQFIATENLTSNSTKIPTSLCEKFKNLNLLLFMEPMGLEEIDEKSLKNCKNLDRLGIEFNKIQKISEKAFASLSNLTDLSLVNNQLTFLHENMFANLTNLKILHLNDNMIKVLPDGIFASLIILENLLLSNNYLTTLSYSALNHCFSNYVSISKNGTGMTTNK